MTIAATPSPSLAQRSQPVAPNVAASSLGESAIADVESASNVTIVTF